MSVKITDNSIYVGGKYVGYRSSGSEKYVYLTNGHGQYKPVARFKYGKAGKVSSSWIKFVLSKMTPEQVVTKLDFDQKVQTSPVELAESLGWLHPNLAAAGYVYDKVLKKAVKPGS